jgi:rhodanese-related sulfurtransferase
VALAIEEEGIGEAHALIGGFDAWVDAGLPTERKMAAAGTGG